MSASKLRIDGLRKAYGSVVALYETTLDVSDGEFVTLLGPSGSGKTTLLHAVAGLVEPDAGVVWIDGKDATYFAPNRRDIGMVFQNYALFPHLSVFENIAFPLRMRGCRTREVRERVDSALALVRLSEFGTRLPRELSGGQQQRVALARCVVYRPSIVLMDEPLGALDKKLREQMQFEIKRIHRELRATVLYVTHDQEEAMTMSDRICLMRAGRIEQIGTPRELYARPRSVYAADFLGDSNLLSGDYVGNGRVRLSGNAEGALVSAAPVEDISRGSRVRCLIRPEAVRLADGMAPDNTLDATVEEIVLAGGVTKYVLALKDQTVLRATMLTSSAGTPHAIGDRIRVGFEASDVRILRDSPL
jgi:putative spermidine/putrescine transport system ATP-binding protein